jgi:hypothetical protein
MKRTLTLLLALSAVACGDDDGEGRPRYRVDVDVPNTRNVSDLDDDDLDRICESYDVYVDTNVTFDSIAYIACLPVAIVTSAGDQDDCQRALDSCTDAFPKPIDIQAQVRNREVCYSTLRDCRASVTEFEGCVNVSLDLALDILDNWTCGSAADKEVRDRALRAMDTVSVCADLDAACSQFASPGPD